MNNLICWRVTRRPGIRSSSGQSRSRVCPHTPRPADEGVQARVAGRTGLQPGYARLSTRPTGHPLVSRTGHPGCRATEDLSRHSVREIRGRRHLSLQERQRGPGAVEQLGGSIYSLQARSAPAKDEDRLLQGHEPARRLSEPDVRLSRLCVPAEGGDMARQSARGRVPACSQSEGTESNQANDPAMGLASTERPDPG